jgi:predicted permease
LLALAIPGFIFAKIKMFSPTASGTLSVIVLYGCQPVLIITSFQGCAFNPDIAVNMLLTAGITTAVHLIMFAIVKFAFIKWQKDDKVKLVKYLSVFSNCGFMGLPFLQSLFGDSAAEVLIFGGVVIVIFNILTWSVGVFMMTGDKKQINIKNMLLNPTVISLLIAVLMFFTIQKPLVDIFAQNSFGDKVFTGLTKSINFLAEMVTPLAMTVLGMRIAKVNFKQLFTDKWAYVNVFNKLILMGMITILIVAWLPVSQVVKYTLFFLLSMPSANNTVLFAVNFGGDSESASVFVLLSTILSIATIPLMFLIMSGIA